MPNGIVFSIVYVTETDVSAGLNEDSSETTDAKYTEQQQ
ncbi:hypothetical protein VTL71DRAFT_9709 [Oculimacula yallundae]|uniref:Uncharacterized protein n=1 Tax=Oculimacula yallundae TaxID=86028 RepID=A0ABR4BRM4_9HELO